MAIKVHELATTSQVRNTSNDINERTKRNKKKQEKEHKEIATLYSLTGEKLHDTENRGSKTLQHKTPAVTCLANCQIDTKQHLPDSCKRQ